MTRALPRTLPQDINTICTTDIMAHGDHPGIASSSSFLPFVPGPTCRDSEFLYVPPLNYKWEGALRLIQTQVTQDTTRAHEQYNTQWSRVLRSGGPNHSKLLRVLACSFPNLTKSKTLRPLLILGFRAGALRHPAGDFLSNTHQLLRHLITIFCSFDYLIQFVGYLCY
jgi:hypothetical protein